MGLTFYETVNVSLLTIGITFGTNSIFHYLKNKLDWFADTKKFNRDNSYDQLKNLYLYLYSVICQSEYLRVVFDIKGSHDDIPFLEAEKKKEIKKHTLDFNNIDFNNFTFNTVEYEISDAVTEFNKINICEYILNHKEYASQELLKLSVAYRFVHQYYLDETLESKEYLEKFRNHELILIREIVKTIVKETNSKLKLCRMDYNKDEIHTGIIKIKYFNT
mgnify:CR=1 FL=1